MDLNWIGNENICLKNLIVGYELKVNDEVVLLYIVRVWKYGKYDLNKFYILGRLISLWFLFGESK